MLSRRIALEQIHHQLSIHAIQTNIQAIMRRLSGEGQMQSPVPDENIGHIDCVFICSPRSVSPAAVG